MVFVWPPTKPRKSKQPCQYSLVFEWSLYEILLDHANQNNFFNFDSFLTCFCMKSYKTTEKEAKFSILTGFWMAFVWNPTRPRKSKKPFQIWLDCNLFNFDLFLNGFCMKCYQKTRIEAIFSILTRSCMVFVWNATRPRKSKQPSQFWLVFEWYLYEILLDHANRRNRFKFYLFSNGLCMK